MKRIYFLLALTIFGSTTTFSQSENNLPFNLNYLPPSPTASSLAKFGDIPVGNATGIPQITVPVYSYQSSSENLSLSISLDFHAGGFRVEEVAGNVGLGWALNAGGSITRSMRGLPDDLENNGFLARGHQQTPLGNEDFYVKNTYDSEQDLFHFNANGLSGKFVLGPDGHGVLITPGNLKIEPVFSSSSSGLPLLGFCIKDDKGLRYYFTEREDTQTRLAEAYPVSAYTSTWYLSRIENPFTQTRIIFNYTSHIVYQEINNTETRMNRFTSYQSVSSDHESSTDSKRNYQIISKRLSKITIPNGVNLRFVYSTTGRCDLMGDNALSRIEITDSITHAKKSFSLFQSYVGIGGSKTSYTSPPCNTSGSVSLKTIRLRLDSLKESAGGMQQNPYIFEYHDTQHLPPTDSKYQDIFGYFNGTKNTANTLVPRLAVNLGGHYSMLKGANRRTDTAAIKASAIKKIIYPTKGYTQFEFEANRAGDERLFETLYVEKTLVINSNFYLTGSSIFTMNRLDSNQAWKTNIKMLAWCPGLNTGCSIRVSIKTPDGSVVLGSAIFDYPSVGTEKQVTIPVFPNGPYMLEWSLLGGTGCACNDLFDLKISWLNVQVDTTQFAGGIRLKRQIDHDGLDHANNVITDYEYVLENGASSGTVSNFLEYSSRYEVASCTSWDPPSPPTTLVKTYVVRASTANHPLHYNSGSPVSYTRVKVKKYSVTSSIGEDIFYYTGYSNPLAEIMPDFSDRNKSPFIPLQIYDWKIGNMIRHEVYESSGSMVKRTVNDYHYFFDIIDTVKNFKVAIDLLVENPVCSGGNSTYIFKHYYWSAGRKELIKTTETIYTPAGDSVVNTISYKYHPSYFYPKTVRKTSSLADTIEVRNYHAYDYSLGGVYQRLVDSNMIHQPVSAETWVLSGSSAALTEAGASEYAFESGLLILKKYHKLATRSPLPLAAIGQFNPSVLLRGTDFEQEVVFEKYDARQNPVQVKLRGITKSYIWDSSGTYPVAEATNAVLKNIFYTSFEGADGNSNLGDAKTGRKSKTGGYTRVLTGLTSGAYILSYWKKTGSSWNLQTSTITVAGTSYTINLTGQVDEVRFYPVVAQMTTYTYESLKGMTGSCDATNRITRYEYDGFGRLNLVLDQDGNILQKICYNYTGQPEACNIFYNAARSGNFTKACPAGYTGSTVTYTVPANIYSAHTQSAANQLAQDDVNAYGQAYANANGVCTIICTSGNCNGVNKKCVYGVCETGIRVNTNSYKSGSNYVCVYHYEWSDGSWSPNYTETDPWPCPF